MPATRLIRLLSLFLAMGLVMAGCAPKMDDFSSTAKPIGDFKLGYTIVVVDKPKILPLSRTAPDDEWKAALETAIKQRFGHFKGTGTYHIAIELEAYALAQPGVPILVAPKSVAVISANVWRPEGKINPKPEEMAVWEGMNGDTLVGSGLTKTKEEQMQRLAYNAAGQIEEWLRKNEDWFRPDGLVSKRVRADGTVDMSDAKKKKAGPATPAAAPAPAPAPAPAAAPAPATAAPAAAAPTTAPPGSLAAPATSKIPRRSLP